MNDRFRFRVWKKVESKMVESVTYLNPLLFDEEIAPDEAKNYILLQCTGLKDKNGKLIYEGDILGGIYENLDIFYCPQCMQFELHAKGYGCMCCNGDIHWCEVVEDNNKLEVISNIYENKELLESEGK